MILFENEVSHLVNLFHENGIPFSFGKIFAASVFAFVQIYYIEGSACDAVFPFPKWIGKGRGDVFL